MRLALSTLIASLVHSRVTPHTASPGPVISLTRLSLHWSSERGKRERPPRHPRPHPRGGDPGPVPDRPVPDRSGPTASVEIARLADVLRRIRALAPPRGVSAPPSCRCPSLGQPRPKRG